MSETRSSTVHAVAFLGISPHTFTVTARITRGIPELRFDGLTAEPARLLRHLLSGAFDAADIGLLEHAIAIEKRPACLPVPLADLVFPIALAVLAVHTPQPPATPLFAAGQLGTDGRIDPIRGAGPALDAAITEGLPVAFVAAGNEAEIADRSGIDVHLVTNLADAFDILRHRPPRGGHRSSAPPTPVGEPATYPPLSTITRLPNRILLRAAGIVAAGRHGVLATGAFGDTFTSAVAALSPDLDPAAADTVAIIRSLTGHAPGDPAMRARPPLVRVDATVTMPGLIGTHRAGDIQLGALTLAHHGVLHLTDATDLPRHLIGHLDRVLRAREIELDRYGRLIRLPADVQPIITATPCPCGRPEPACTCPTATHSRHRTRLARLQALTGMTIPAIDHTDIAPIGIDEATTMATRAANARATAADRWASAGSSITTNARASRALLTHPRFRIQPALRHVPGLLRDAPEPHGRLAHRIIPVAWTIADLDGTDLPTAEHIDEALSYLHPLSARRR